ncbi:MAG: L-serine ammonia-lyase, partial [Comamonas sp.]
MLSVFDIFKIGIGPSSSHTVGPMRAALMFARSLEARGCLADVARMQVELFGSLGATGRGHATDQGVLLGLLGEAPDTVVPASVAPRLATVRRARALSLLGQHRIDFDPQRDIAFLGERALPEHPNAMRLAAFDAQGALLREAHYFSVGGGFVIEGGAAAPDASPATQAVLPYPFSTGDALMAHAARTGLSIAALVLANECTWRPEAQVRAGLLHIWQVMQDCVQRGFGIDNPQAAATLPGLLRMRRRAPELYRSLSQDSASNDPLAAMDWVNAYAMAVNEENAAGGRVVTAPTNGAAGVVPAVLHYYTRFVPQACEQGVIDFLLTAGAIGMLYKTNA